MQRIAIKNGLLIVAVALSLSSAGCLGRKNKSAKNNTDTSAEPDKVLYTRATDDIKHGRYTEGRLSLQTLINTYPDSEYLAKAKLAIGDSYFKEGGTSGLTQSVAEYKDFITFFPFLEEAPYAQMQVGMAHYRLMEKPDRDRTQAQFAEDEFQNFLLKYPQSPLAPQAEQRLREVQEMLAEGDYRVGRFYYLKQDYRASAARLLELTSRYPLYSQSDRALWMLGNIYSQNEKTRELANQFYARIVRDYPLSSLVGDSKNRLLRAGVPVPQSDPGALARMEQEQKLPRSRPSIMHRSLGLLKTGPDVSMAARTGQPNLNPPNEPTSATEVLKPGSGTPGSVGASGGSGSGSSVAVETISPGSSSSSTSGGNASTTDAGASASGSSAATDNSPAAGATTAPANGSAASPSNSSDPNSKKESSSKKKKGLRKLIPW
jgi:outer membrane protein assembly factor BamD